MQKRIGLLGGTFNPIHLGHLNLAMELKEKRQLDEVWFIPAHINPHKALIPPASIEHRLKMLQLAIGDFPNFTINECELRRSPPSYTIDTIRALLADEPGHAFFWLMGEDNLSNFAQWHQPEEIVKLVPLLIGCRFLEMSSQHIFKNPLIEEAVKKGFTKTRMMDISSTELRLRLSQNLYCGHLIPPEIRHYIQKNHLYELK